MADKLTKQQIEANFYLATAKLNKGVSVALYYMGLVGAPALGIFKACQENNFSDGIGRVVAGGLVGASLVLCSAVLRKLNIPLLRDYVNARNQANNQKVK